MPKPKIKHYEFPSILPSIHMLRCPKCGSSQIEITGVKGVLGKSIIASAAAEAGGALGGVIHDAITEAQRKKKTPMPVSTIRFICGACGEKFETEPHMTDQTEILEAPFAVSFTVKNGVLDDTKNIFINGVFLQGTPKYTTSLTLNTMVRYNTLILINSTGKTAANGIYQFEASPAGNLNLLYTKKQFSVI